MVQGLVRAALYARVSTDQQEKGVSIAGFGDHGDTKGLYIFDPDGNEIELYAIAPQDEGTPLEELLTEPQASRAG